MPIVSWNPAVGTSFDIPGANTLAGGSGVDADATPMSAGDSSSYSTTPTLGQVNAGSDVNQLIAYVRRQMRLLDVYGMTSMSSASQPSYVSSNAGTFSGTFADTISGVGFAYLRQKVDNIRTLWGLPATTWSFDPGVSATTIAFGTAMSEIRAALEPSGTLNLAQQTYTTEIRSRRIQEGISKNLGRTGSLSTNNSTTMRAGIQFTSSSNGGTGIAFQNVFYVYIPEWLNDTGLISSAAFKGTMSLTGSPSTLSLYTCTNATQPIVTGDKSALGSFLNSFSPVSGAFSVSIPAANIVAAAGSLLKIVLLESNETSWTTGDNVTSDYADISPWTFEIVLT